MRYERLVAASSVLAVLWRPIPNPPRGDRGADIMAKSRAVYAHLKSYADTGAVDVIYGSLPDPSHDHHTFRTFFRAPRKFYFDFVKLANVDRLVVWSDDAAFHRWWRTTGGIGDYPKGQGTTAFTNSDYPTVGSVTLIASLVFPNAGLGGTLSEFGDADATLEGTEKINGHTCYKVVGVAKSVYAATGKEVDVRKTTIWVDSTSLLIRRIREDPRDILPNHSNSTTVTFEPHADPVLEDARFVFTPSQDRRP